MTPTIELSLARPSDAVRIAGMSRDLIELGLNWRWRSARVLQQILDPDSNVVVARQNGTLVGFAIMHYELEVAHLLLFAVRPAQRRRGIGRALIGWLEKTARTAGIAHIQLEVRSRNRAGRAFYRALGYREVQRLPFYYCGTETAVRMRHDLRVSV